MGQRANRFCVAAFAAAVWASACADSLKYVDPLIGTEGKGSEYGGMMPYVGVPFGSFQMVPMTRLNRVGQLSFNQADDTLIDNIELHCLGSAVNCLGRRVASYTTRNAEEIAKLRAMLS